MDNPSAPEIRSEDGQTTVVLREDLDLYTVPSVRPTILDAVTAHPSGKFRVDMSHVSFVDSAGLALLLALRKHPQLDGRFSVLVANESHPERVLHLTHLDTYIDIISVPAPEPAD